MKNKKNRKLLKVLTSVAALGLVAAVSFGATMAYLTARTERKVNEFASGGVSITLNEPKYNLETDKNYSPGDTKQKDPQIDIGTASEDVYVAMTLEFYVKSEEKDADPSENLYEAGDGTIWEKYKKSDFESKIATLNSFSPRWVQLEGTASGEGDGQLTNQDTVPGVVGSYPTFDRVYAYYYKASSDDVLAKLTNSDGEKTSQSIFDSITFVKDSDVMNAKNSTKEGAFVGGKEVPEVKIVATAYAVRADSYTDASPTGDALKALQVLILQNAAGVGIQGDS